MRAAEDLLRAWVDSDRGADGRFCCHELVEDVGLVVAWQATGVDLLTATQVKVHSLERSDLGRRRWTRTTPSLFRVSTQTVLTSDQRLSASSADATISTAVASPSPTGTRGLAVTLSYLCRIEEVAPSTEAAMAAADAAHHPFWSAAMRNWRA
jgi:hypothetical protein